MFLLLKNIGKLKQVEIEINGITVIAGENNTGKSTVSRALFSIFNSFFSLVWRQHHAKIIANGCSMNKR